MRWRPEQSFLSETLLIGAQQLPYKKQIRVLNAKIEGEWLVSVLDVLREIRWLTVSTL